MSGVHMHNNFPIVFTRPHQIHKIARNACTTGNLEPLRKYLRTHYGINQLDSNNNTTLLLAIRKGPQIGSLSVVKFLIERGANPRVPNKDGYDAIMCALIYNNYEVLNWFFETGLMYQFTLKGYNILHIACQSGSEVLGVVLKHMTWSADDLNTALPIACSRNVDCLKILEYGTEGGFIDCNYKIPLRYCINFGYYEDLQKIANLGHLLQYKVDIFVSYNRRKQSTSFIKELVGKRPKTILKIQNMMADIDLNRKDEYGYNYLLYLCERLGYGLTVEFLERAIHQLDINIQNPEGDTPLHLLIKHRDYDCAKVLIQRNPLFSRNKDGKTALYYLLLLLQSPYEMKVKRELIELCLQRGAELDDVPEISDGHPQIVGNSVNLLKRC